MADQFIGKQFKVQMQGYLHELLLREGLYTVLNNLAEEGVSLTRDQIEALAEGHGTPSPRFAQAFGKILNERFIVSISGMRDFITAAGHETRFAEGDNPGFKSAAQFEIDDALARERALEQRILQESRKMQNPKKSEEGRSFSEILEKHIKMEGGSDFSSFMREVLDEWKMSNPKFAAFVNEKISKPDALSAGAVQRWLPGQKPLRDSIDMLVEAFSLEYHEELAIYQLAYGYPLSEQQLNEIIQSAKGTGDTGPMAQELYHASGILRARLMEITGVDFQAWKDGAKTNEESAKNFADAVLMVNAIRIGDEKKIEKMKEAITGLLAVDRTNPMERYTGPGFVERMQQSLTKGESFPTFLENFYKDAGVSPERFNEYVNTKAKVSGEDALASASGRDWLRGTAPIAASINVFVKAFKLTEEEEIQLYKLARGYPLKDEELTQLIKDAREKGETGALVRKLYDASGIPEDRLKEITDVDFYKWRSGQKTYNEEAAAKFAEATLYADVMRKEEGASSRLAQLKENVSQVLVLDRTNPMERYEGKSFKEALEESFKNGQNWNQFIRGFIDTANVSPEKFGEYVNSREGIVNEALSYATVRNWTHETGKPSAPHIKLLMEVFGLDERNELQIHKMADGYEIKLEELDKVITQAQADGDTGPLVKMLIESSGIIRDRMSEMVGMAVGTAYGWMKGDKIAFDDVRVKLVETTLAANLKTPEPDPAIVERQEKIKALLVFDKSKPEPVLDTSKSFADILEDSFSKRHNWSQFVKNVLETMKAAPEHFCAHMRKVATEKELAPENYSLTNTILYYWMNYPDGNKPSRETMDIFRTLFDLDDLAMKKMWKISSGRFLKQGEFAKWLDEAEQAKPILIEKKAALTEMEFQFRLTHKNGEQVAQVMTDHREGGLKDVSALATAKKVVRTAEKNVSGLLVENLVDTCGVPDTELRLELGTQQIGVWKNGTPINNIEMARSFIAKTLEMEKAAGNTDITKENEDRLYRLVTARPITVEQVLAENDHRAWSGSQMWTALTGLRGVVSWNDQELGAVLHTSEKEAASIRRARRPMSEEQRDLLYAALKCENGDTIAAVSAILARKGPSHHRAKDTETETTR